MHIHGNLDLLAKALEHRNQTFDGEAIELRSPHARKITVVNTGDLLGFASAKLAIV